MKLETLYNLQIIKETIQKKQIKKRKYSQISNENLINITEDEDLCCETPSEDDDFLADIDDEWESKDFLNLMELLEEIDDEQDLKTNNNCNNEKFLLSNIFNIN